MRLVLYEGSFRELNLDVSHRGRVYVIMQQTPNNERYFVVDRELGHKIHKQDNNQHIHEFDMVISFSLIRDFSNCGLGALHLLRVSNIAKYYVLVKKVLYLLCPRRYLVYSTGNYQNRTEDFITLLQKVGFDKLSDFIHPSSRKTCTLWGKKPKYIKS